MSETDDTFAKAIAMKKKLILVRDFPRITVVDCLPHKPVLRSSINL
jgi:hypothetical protein